VPLPRRFRLDTVAGKGDSYVTHTVKLPLRLHDHYSEEVFAVAHLGIGPDVILGLPWLEKFCPEAISALKQFGKRLLLFVWLLLFTRLLLLSLLLILMSPPSNLR
jgi:hypothetical protein